MQEPLPTPDEMRLRAIVSALPDQIMRIRADGTFLEQVENEVQSPLDSRTMVGTRIQDAAALPALVKRLLLQAVRRALDTGGLCTVEYQLPVAGELHDREARLVPCGPGEVLALVRDISEQKRAAAELKRVNGIQSLILENSAFGIAFVRHRTLEWVNARVGELLELPLDQLQGASTRILYPSEEVYETLGSDAYPVLARGEESETELQMRRGDGSLFWCRFVGRALDPARPDDGSIWVFEDISERKNAEQKLRENLHYLQTLLEAIPSPIFFKGTDLRYLGCNGATEAFLGRSREDLIGKSVFDIAPAHLARGYQEADAALMASGGTQVYQAKVRNGRGEDRDVVFHKAVLQNLAGDVVGMVGMVLDITDREASARELARTKALLEAILEQSPTPILVVDAPDTTIRICNHAALEVLGILEEPRQLGRRLDGITRNWSYLDIEGEIIPEERLPIARALQGRATPACAIRVLRKDGSERTCLGFGVPILDQDGKLIAGMAIFPDVTEQRRAEEALQRAQKLEDLGIMAGRVAHDFNNLFQMIQGLLEPLLSRGGAETASAAGRALKVLERAAGLAGRMLDYSGKSHREPEPLDLNLLVHEATEFLPGFLQRPRPLALTLAPDLPRAEGDRDQIRRVITAVLQNAAEASSGRGAPIEVATRLVAAEEVATEPAGLWIDPPDTGPRLCLAIRDHGSGIPAGDLPRIFDPFFSTKEHGRGLGLTAALGILRAHGASVHVHSAPGQGTSFRIFLPLHAGTPPAKNPALPHPAGRTVLLVDDEPLLLDVVGEAVRELMGLPVLVAHDGKEALDLFREQADAIGLVLMDATMPRLSGPEAFAAMRQLRPDIRGILCSGFSEQFGEETARSFGFLAFLKKPFSLEALQETIRKVLAS